MTSEIPAGSVSASLEFVAALPQEIVNLVAINPDAEGLHGITRPKGHPDLETFVRRWNGRHNLYFSANEPRADAPDTKLTKAHIAKIRFIFADLDAGKGEDFGAGRERLKRIASALTAHPIAGATFVIDSGGGFQPFWQLAAPMDATPANIALAEAQGRGVALALGGDNTFDVNRIMRLPGTVNLPDAKKRARGRTVTEARVWAAGVATTDLDDIAASWPPAAAPKKEGDQVDAKAIGLDLTAAREFDEFDALPAELRDRFTGLCKRRPDFAALWAGDFAGFEDQSRSGQLYRLAGFLKGNEFSATDYGRLAWVWGHGYAADWPEMDDWRIARTLARAWGNWDGGEVGLRGAPAPDEVFSALPDDFEIPIATAPVVVREIVCLPASELAAREVPPREWLVPDLIPAANVTLLSGDGGTGKSLLALQLAVGVALGREWVGARPSPGRAVFLSAEDELDELHRRLAGISDALGVGLGDLADVVLIPLAEEDALLVTEDRTTGDVKETPLWRAVCLAVETHAPRLLVLDTSADLFGGGESDRKQVRQFVSMLRRLAIRAGMAIVLLSHPSVAGMLSGSGISGSTSWNNSVRSRLYLHRPKNANGTLVDRDLRVIESMKANYGPAGQKLFIRWEKGVFIPTRADPAELVTIAEVGQILDEIDSGANRSNAGNGQWAGKAVGRVCGFVAKDDPDRAKAVLAYLEQRRFIGATDIIVAGRGTPAWEVLKRPDPADAAFFGE